MESQRTFRSRTPEKVLFLQSLDSIHSTGSLTSITLVSTLLKGKG